MLAPAVAAGKGVKGERECRHCLRFLALRPPNGGLRNGTIIVARPAPAFALRATAGQVAGLASHRRNFRKKERGKYL